MMKTLITTDQSTEQKLLESIESLLVQLKTARQAVSTGSFINNDDVPECPIGMDPDEFIDEIEKKRILESQSRTQKAIAVLRSREATLNKGVNTVPVALKEGCVFKRKDGRWCGKYCEEGKQISVYAPSRADAVSKVNEKIRLRDAENEKQNISRKIRLSEWVEEWIAVYKKGKLKESSLSNIFTSLVAHAKKSPIYRKECGKITSIDVQKFLNGIESISARARTYVYLRECLDALVKNRTIKENVCDFITVPKKPTPKEKTVPTPEQMETFLNNLNEVSPSYYLLAKFIASTGLRRGETYALLWSDISWEDGTISVSKAYDTVSKKITEPKSRKAVRVVPLFDGALEVLQKIKQTAKPIFSFIGKTASNKNFPAACERAGFPNITFHVLRHVFTTRCLENGVDPKIIQKWLGHAKLDMTMNTYAHVNGDFEQTQTLKMAKNRG